ncbi:MAG: hypothetical protein IT210_09760 [Armatimonadetes bacterium]|nr:hypothetical protein [Armatimonadota bacterium]
MPPQKRIFLLAFAALALSAGPFFSRLLASDASSGAASVRNPVVERLRIQYENAIYTRLADNPPEGVANDTFTVRADIATIDGKSAKGRMYVRGVQYFDNNLPRGRLAFTNMAVIIEGEGTIMCQGMAPDGPTAILGGTGKYLGKIGEMRRIRGYPVGLMAGDGEMTFDYEFQKAVK